MKETCPYFEDNIDQQSEAWQDYQEYLSGFGMQISEPDFAFGRRSKKKIKENANNSPYPGYDFGQNECSHINHDKQSGYYDDPENGEYINKPDHYAYHKLGAYGEVDTGLPKHQDQWASGKVWGRMSEDQRHYLRMKAGIE